MKSFDELKEVVSRLRAEDGCPWDKEQTHSSLKASVIEEAAEVIGGINVLEETGNPENLKERRMIVKSLIAKLQNKYHVSVAEVDEHGWAAQIIQHEIDHLSGIIISGTGTDGGRGKNNL